MIRLFPAIHRFLVLLPAFQEQHVDRARVRDEPVLLKAFPNRMSYKSWGDIQSVERDDFWGLAGVRRASVSNQPDMCVYK